MELKADVDAVLMGRAMAAVIVIVSFAYSVKVAVSVGGFWVFLQTFTTPLAVSFGIIMVTEVLRELRTRQG